MSNKIDYDALLEWYSGKSRETMEKEVIPKLRQSEKQGWWEPGVSRKLTSMLSKMNRLKKLEKALTKGYYTDPLSGTVEQSALHTMHYGWKFDPKARRGHFSPETAKEIGFWDAFREHQRIVVPLNKLRAKLDATRPIPVITTAGVSRTLQKTLDTSCEVKLKGASARVPKIDWKHVDRIVNGKKTRVLVGYIIWSKGIEHGSSRFSAYNSKSKTWNEQCEACGHAIRNSCNWAALEVDDVKGKPHSFWVGTDCAKKLLGYKLSGKPVELIRQ